jgi:2-methylcitrate dehydratase PrpD
MQLSYARLCAPYLAARALLAGNVAAEAFTPKACSDPLALGLARRILIEAKDAGDPNQLTPIEVEIRLHDGSQHVTRLEVVYGNPAKPLTRAALVEKFHTNCEAAARPLAPAKRERLIEGVEHLEDVRDVARLMQALI